MKPDDPVADEILRRTLLAARSARTRRRALKGAFGAVVVLISVFLLSPRPGSSGGSERVVVVAEDAPRLSPVPEEKIAVMVWRGGTPCLEWVELHDLGPVELEFSLAPVFAFADDGL